MNEFTTSNAEIFCEYAGGEVSKWNELKTLSVKHIILGETRLTYAYPNNGDVTLFFLFEHEKFNRKFLSTQFPTYFDLVELPENNPRFSKFLIQYRLNKEKEQSVIQLFTKQKEKYGIEFCEDSITSNLFEILQKLENSQKLSEQDINWLMSRKDLHSFLIRAIRVSNELSNNPWDLIKVSKLFRKHKKPQFALIITDKIQLNNNKEKSAVCTTRGAAYKDLSEYDKAITLAEKAIYFQPDSYYPYNLLGSIYYKKGLFQKGDEYYSKAIELGSSTEIQDAEIEFSLENEAEASVRATAAYLLNKDPQKYSWVRKYLINK